MFCIFCGKEIFDSAVFCKYCGRRVAGNGSQGVPQPIGGMRPGVPVPMSAAEPAPVLMPAAEVIPSPAPEPIPMPVPEPTPAQNSEKMATNKSAPGICPACGVCGTKL
ncbi:MAG: hypothetical protein IJS22_03725 [Lachnospiraceae bacterium]|nr:hypothetical protein [Lachnospiraceae bacterium]